MARVRIERILMSMESDLRRAIADALLRTPGAEEIDARSFTKQLIKSVGRKCNSWESVSDTDVELED